MGTPMADIQALPTEEWVRYFAYILIAFG
jgi:hypothetical protein